MFKKLRDIKNSSVYITPNFPVLRTKRYKLSFLSVVSSVVGYSLLVAIIVIIIIVLTPARNVVFFFENEKLTEQVEKVKELEKKVFFLSKELQNFAASNEKLKYAMIIASTDSLDSNSAIYDSLRQPKKKKLRSGGNLLAVFRDLLDYLSKDSSQLFFIAPVNGVIIKGFEPSRGHMGIDYGIRKGTAVHAALGGVVTFSGFTPDYGNTIMILHQNNFISVYRHCEILMKKEREIVSQGEVIALSGESGYKSTGPHLHFEIWHNGKAVDPTVYLINN